MLLHEPFDFQALSRGSGVLARSGGRNLTYAEGRERSLRIAAALLGLGLAPGERVATIMDNSIDALLIVQAISRAGLVCVALNNRLTPYEWLGMIEDAKARVLIADAAYCNALGDADRKPPIAICAGSRRPGWRALDDIVAEAPPYVSSIPPSPDSSVLQLYTSGTTGKPKGAMLTHRSILANLAQLSFAVGNCVPGQRSMHVLPFFHVFGFVFAMRAMLGGETLILCPSADRPTLLRTLTDDSIAWTGLVPTMIQMLLAEPGVEKLRFPHLRQIIYGASSMPQPVLVEAMRVFGCGFLQGFGMTELSCAGTILSEVDHVRATKGRPDLLASAGRALPGTELRIVDADGETCPPNAIGEIWIRGPQVFAGYWNQTDATAAAIGDGWLRSGDAGSLDDEGYLFIRDRLKDMIVSGGENIYPAEIEAVLHHHPRIAEVSVIGVPDDKWGETVMAVIVQRDGYQLSEIEVDQYCRAYLGGYKRPRRYAFVKALPRNASGKISKRELRTLYGNSAPPPLPLTE